METSLYLKIHKIVTSSSVTVFIVYIMQIWKFCLYLYFSGVPSSGILQ